MARRLAFPDPTVLADLYQAWQVGETLTVQGVKPLRAAIAVYTKLEALDGTGAPLVLEETEYEVLVAALDAVFGEKRNPNVVRRIDARRALRVLECLESATRD
jgi:hypothetical protein